MLFRKGGENLLFFVQNLSKSVQNLSKIAGLKINEDKRKKPGKPYFMRLFG